MIAQDRTASILKTMGRPSRKYYLMVALAGAAVGWFLLAWSYQLQEGLIVAGLGDWGSGGGVAWGIYIGSFIWWVGIAHGGIIISAAVRLFKLKVFYPVARIAELTTIAALSIAGLYIVVHTGRPDRLVTSIIPAYPTTVQTSPLIWDVTVITLYFVLTATYILLSLRHDIYAIRSRAPRYDIHAIRSRAPRQDIYAIRGQAPRHLAPLHLLLTLGYQPEEDEKVQRMVWWLAFAVIILAPLLLHGGVIPWLFQIIASMPGWYSAIQGPTFLSIALTSAVGSVICIGYIFRRVYGWEELIPDRVFARLGGVLALIGLLFLWLQLQQIMVGAYAAPEEVRKVTEAKLEAPLYWLAIGMIAASVVYLGAQVVWSSLFSLSRTVVAALLPVVATLIEKTLFVVEGLMHPGFSLYKGVPGSYFPTWVEFSSIIGAFGIVVLFFAVVAKVIPVIELEAEEEG